MLKRLFKGSAPVTQTIARPSRNKASRWAAVMPALGRRVRVVAIQRETPDTVSVAIEPCDGGRLEFSAGQYLTHCFEIDGEPQRRAYSLSVAEGAGQLRFTCKAVPGGRVSTFVCERLREGDEYEVRGPSGSFRLPPGQAPLLLIAAGSGITPCMSLLETALQQQRPVTLIYGSRDQDHIIFRDRLDALARAHDGLQLLHVLSQPAPGWDGEQGHIDTARVLRLATPGADTEVFLCGPQGLMDSVSEGLLAHGLAERQLHREDFRSVNHATVAHPTTPQPIRFTRSGVEVRQEPGQSILDAALAQGVALDFSCTVGGCAACKLKVLKGRAALDEPNCLSANEQAQGYTLACSAYALEPLEVEA